MPGSSSVKKKSTAKKSTAKHATAKHAVAKGRPSGRTAKKASAKKAVAVPKKESGEEVLSPFQDEIILMAVLIVAVLMLLSFFNVCGVVGTGINFILFGSLGMAAYLFPFLLFFGIAFFISNRGIHSAKVKLYSSLSLYVTFMALLELAVHGYHKKQGLAACFVENANAKNGGGILGGAISKGLCFLFGKFGAYAVLMGTILLLLMLITEKFLFAGLRNRRRKQKLRVAAMASQKREVEEEEWEYDSVEPMEEEGYEEVSRRKVLPARQRAKVVRFPKKSKNLRDLSILKGYEREEEDGTEDGWLAYDTSGSMPKKEPSYGGCSLKAGGGNLNEEVPFYERELESKFNHKEEESTWQTIPIIKAMEEEEPDTALHSKEQHNENRDAASAFRIEVLPANESADAVIPVDKPPMENCVQAFSNDHGTDPMETEAEVKPNPEYIKTTAANRLPGEDNQEKEGHPASQTEKESGMPPLPVSEPETGKEACSVSASAGPETAVVCGQDSGQAGQANTLSETAQPPVSNAIEEAGRLDQPKKNRNSKELGQGKAAPPKRKYEFPPIDLLSRPDKHSSGDSDELLRETAAKLKNTLDSFGVKVEMKNISCGPSVTRFELQPAQGVKVSKITNLTDDIKLSLAAADIRIEAPIPGKAAVGIEVPNKEKTMVRLRTLLEGKEFKNHASNLAFAVGKDIGGNTMVADIAKMPHLLIAGATGSGKSVCINTLIMSILYKADPEDVKLIMVDPKVVELSVYNGIPHLLIPVVTDPKKASGALNWAVVEMTDRYKKFAELGVRDIKGYNARVKAVEGEKEERFQKMPQIVIIVDELADLMMVAPGEVEDAICRLAQLARAAGIHLVIATQRPSVNVITGLIKANVPSRVAFAVSSAVDSRTIIDSGGAEKLLGNGDMLFFPSGYPKPVRVQGSFVSDQEVSDVVAYLTEKNGTMQYDDTVASQITQASQAASQAPGRGPDRDDYFIDAGRFVIEKDKASIGMLQRVYKIGFNRAARIMDQLCEAGVVGDEEGTKPRKVLMSCEQFEAYIEENG